MDYLAENARCDDLLDFVKVGLKPIVLKGEEQAAVLFSRLNDAVEIGDAAGDGLFADDVKAPVERLDAGVDVQRTGQRVHKEVKAALLEHRAPVLVDVRVEIGHGLRAALGQLIGRRDNLKPAGVLPQMLAVDVVAAAALSSHGHANLVLCHV